MPNLNTFHTLDSRVKKYQTDKNLEKLGEAFDWVALEILFGLTDDEIEEAITDGTDDGGIDAVYVLDRDVHICSFTYTGDFNQTHKNFPENKVDKLLVTFDNIMNRSANNVNDALTDKILEIWELFDTGGGPVNFKFYFYSNKETLVEAAQSRIEKHLEKYRFAEALYGDLDDLVSMLLDRKTHKVNGELNFIDKSYFERSDGPLKAIVATVAAGDLLKMVEDSSDSTRINEFAFDENCRVYLKRKNPVNKGIYESALSGENYKFFYLNNGITIVCDSCDYPPLTRSPRATLKNFQIVNGGQTTHALFEARQDNPEAIENILILIRIYEAKDRKIAEKISETTNRQTPVNNRDLRANESIQQRLEEQFKTLGYFYERKKNQFIDEAAEKRFDNELLAQLYLAYYLDMPSEAKNSKTVVFGKMYDQIFDEERITAEKLLLPYLIYLPLEKMKREIQSKKRRKESISEKDAFVSRATFHLLNLVKYISEKEKLDPNSQSDRLIAVEAAVKNLEEVVKSESKKRGGLYTHDKFFKEIATNEIVRKHILSKYS